MKKVLRLLALLFLIPSLLLFADQREEPIDVIIALDKSLSMVEEIEAVKEYINTYLIDELLITGDFFLVVAFYGNTEIPVSMQITGRGDKEKAKEIISGLIADGRFTDIGNALDVLGKELDAYSDPDRKKFLLLITDGIQEAPLESRYYSPDGSFNHEFLENTKTIQKKGWKIQILGIGTYQAARELAEELSGKYTEISETPTSREMAEKTKDFLATIELTEEVKLSRINNKGEGTLTLVMESKGYTEEKVVVISAIELSVPGTGMESENILPGTQSVSISLEPETPRTERLPVLITQELASGDYSGSIQFFFTSEEHFIPVVMEVEFHVKSFFGNYWVWLLVGIVLLAVLIILLISLMSRLVKAKLRFQLIVEGQSPDEGKDRELQTLREDKPLFLDESEDVVRISKARNPKSLAKLMLIQKGIRMTLLKSNRFPKLRELPKNVIECSFRIRAESGKDITVRFGSVS